MRIKHDITLLVTEDTDLKDPLYGPVDETLATTQTDAYTNMASGKIAVAVDATKTVPFGDVQDVRGLYLEVDTDCQITLNEGDPIIVVLEEGATVAKFLLEASLTKVEITVASDGTALTGTYCVWGDPPTV